MSIVHGWMHRVYVLIRGERYAEEVRREMNFHRELDALAQGGNSLGNETYHRESVRETTVLAWLDRLERNVMYALRGLRRSPGFSATVIVTIALGVGVNATMFSLLDRLLLRPPPGVSAPNELRRVYNKPGYTVTPRGGNIVPRFGYPSFAAMQDAWRNPDANTDATAQLIAFTSADSLGLGEAGETPVRVSFVSSNFFSVLGVRPIAGRTFGTEEAAIESPTPVMVISERLWRSTFGGERAVLGRRVRIGRLNLSVVGIAPGDFAGLAESAADAWIPLNNYGGTAISGDTPWYKSYGYSLTLAARLGRAANETELTTRANTALRALASSMRGRDSADLILGSIIEARGPAEKPSEIELTTRVAAVAVIVLLLACANVASLMLTRATRRAREIAVRRALGASRTRLYEQLLTESIVLAALGGVAAVLLATWGATALQRLLFPKSHWVGALVNWRVLGFSAAVVFVAGIAMGLAPALLSTRGDVVASLRAGATERGYRRSKLGAALLGLQAALCVVLLVGAGLLVRSRANVEAIDLGIEPSRIVFSGLGVSREKQYGSDITPVLAQVSEGMRGFPGVEATALATSAPMTGISFTTMFRPNGDSMTKIAGQYPTYTNVSVEYFKVAGIRLLSGRLFTSADREGAPLVMVVSRKMARLAWPAQQALGQCVLIGKQNSPCTTVVGVVEDTHGMGVIEAPAMAYYRPLAQSAGFRAPFIVLRVNPARAAAVSTELRTRLARTFPDAPSISARPVAAMIDSQFRSWRIGADLFTAFGLLAVIVAAVGIYSTVAYGVAMRTHEIGVRMALGADVRAILNLIVSDGMMVVGSGIVVGVASALSLGRFIASLLFGVTASDAATLIGAVAILAAVAVCASLVPAWRGARVDAMVALRTE
jgi:putative ABC transport system permease protein